MFRFLDFATLKGSFQCNTMRLGPSGVCLDVYLIAAGDQAEASSGSSVLLCKHHRGMVNMAPSGTLECEGIKVRDHAPSGWTYWKSIFLYIILNESSISFNHMFRERDTHYRGFCICVCAVLCSSKPNTPGDSTPNKHSVELDSRDSWCHIPKPNTPICFFCCVVNISQVFLFDVVDPTA